LGGIAALVCAVSFALLMLAMVMVVVRLAMTMTITNRILNDIRKEAIPLIGKLQATMDHINTEMGYVDGILKSSEKLAERANSATKAAQKVVTSPLTRMLGLGIGIQRALGFRASRKERSGDKDWE
jgi:predicted PurR-regulated permease PerM